ncbi:origin recognition complex subunit 2-like [Lytechinus pictus]|uniref:origin recognition complex subunit 2-like n=1 Tax=Lytechinus pictus TaxID=7653 RepID=UPI0030B9BD1C
MDKSKLRSKSTPKSAHKKSKQRMSKGISVMFVGNDDVMHHIMEEASETKVRKDKIHTMASSEPEIVSTPVRSTRKQDKYQQESEEEDGNDEEDNVEEEEEKEEEEIEDDASIKENTEVPEAASRPMRLSRKQINYNEDKLASRRVCDEETKNEEKEDDDDDDDEMEEDESDEEDKDDVLGIVSEVLLDRDGPLGTEVYSFKTPKRSGKMAEIAAKSVDRQQMKRIAIKRKLKRPIGMDKDDSDFDSDQSSDDNDDDDDYECKDDMNSDTSSERSITIKRTKRASIATDMIKKQEQTPKVTGKGSKVSQLKKGEGASKGSTPGGVRKSNRRAAKDVTSMQSNMAEEYFVAHSGQALTSDHTLSRLETPQMGSGQLAEALESAPNSYTKEMTDLFEEHCALFNKWMYHLSNDFNILLYGLGSKRRLVEEFRRRQLKDYTSIVINGYFPSLTVKSILNAITDDVIDDVCNHRNMADQLEFIEEKLDEMDEPLFLLIHNLDGSMLRGSKVQSVLSKVAQVNNVHILASIDHINAPLIWDQERSSTFRWMWYDVTTFDPYTDETSYENSLLVQQSGMLALSSLTHVLRSLTPNARGIFNILVEFQMEHKDDGTYNGMSFHELYQKCREAFLVNSDLTLRAQLTEFRDHKLIKSKKSLDGMELLSIPLDNSTLLEFQQQEEL